MTLRITFAAGQTQLPIPVDTTSDEIAELPEDFTALLSNPSEGLVVGRDTATVTILESEGETILYFSMDAMKVWGPFSVHDHRS